MVVPKLKLLLPETDSGVYSVAAFPAMERQKPVCRLCLSSWLRASAFSGGNRHGRIFL